MPSQTDLDQSGTFRQYVRRWLGPSVGWVLSPDDNVLAISVAGTYAPVNNTTLITVSVNGAVIINLPDCFKGVIPANSLPGKFLALPLTITDIGGFASAQPITINAPAGRFIMGLASISIANAYGAFTLLPDIDTGNWNEQGA